MFMQSGYPRSTLLVLSACILSVCFGKENGSKRNKRLFIVLAANSTLHLRELTNQHQTIFLKINSLVGPFHYFSDDPLPYSVTIRKLAITVEFKGRFTICVCSGGSG